MNVLDEEMRDLVDRGVRPITFDEVTQTPAGSRQRRSPALVAIACAAAVVVVAGGAVALREAKRDGSSNRVGSAPTASIDGADGSQVFTQPSESMSPTLRVNDRYTVHGFEKWVPVRGDVIAMNVPPSTKITGMEFLVKRIVGLPGETIEGRDGRIYVNGLALDESSYLPTTQSTTFGPVEIPKGMYFLLGDNRQYSNDSTLFGPIARSEIRGVAIKLG